MGWRPRRDSNPCFSLERATSCRGFPVEHWPGDRGPGTGDPPAAWSPGAPLALLVCSKARPYRSKPLPVRGLAAYGRGFEHAEVELDGDRGRRAPLRGHGRRDSGVGPGAGRGPGRRRGQPVLPGVGLIRPARAPVDQARRDRRRRDQRRQAAQPQARRLAGVVAELPGLDNLRRAPDRPGSGSRSGFRSPGAARAPPAARGQTRSPRRSGRPRPGRRPFQCKPEAQRSRRPVGSADRPSALYLPYTCGRPRASGPRAGSPADATGCRRRPAPGRSSRRRARAPGRPRAPRPSTHSQPARASG
jgi:hypothetical protein